MLFFFFQLSDNRRLISDLFLYRQRKTLFLVFKFHMSYRDNRRSMFDFFLYKAKNQIICELPTHIETMEDNLFTFFKLSVSYQPISRPILGLSLMLLVIDEQIQLVAHGLNLFLRFQFFFASASLLLPSSTTIVERLSLSLI